MSATTSSPVRLVAVIGSLRRESFHRRLFEAARELVPDDVTLAEVPVRDVPFYDGDVEAAGDPPEVAVLKQSIAAADGVVFFSPEYNRSVPAVVKNVVDWASRPFRAGTLAGKPVGIVAGSPGGHDAAGVREALAHTAASAGGVIHTSSFGVARIAEVVGDGRIDDDARDALTAWLAGFVDTIRAASAAATDGA